jgi:hypothetical protein
LETLARHHRLKALYGITNNHPRRCAPEDLEAALSARDVSYRVQYPGQRDQEILRYAVQHGLGAAIGFRELYPGAGGHIVTLVDFTGDSVKVIDPNDTDGRVRQMTLARFLTWWDGFALVLEPEAIGD